MNVSDDDVIKILRDLIDESDFDELHLEKGDLKLTLRRGTCEGPIEEIGDPSPQVEKSVREDSQKVDNNLVVGTDTAIQGVVIEENPNVKEELLTIKAPILGTFYRSPSPGAPHFVEVGTVVTDNDTVCIIEVMKVMNSVKAGVRGRIAKILVDNATMIEYNQPLFLVEPDGSNHEGNKE